MVIDYFYSLLEAGYKGDSMSITLAVLNNRLDMLKILISESHVKFVPDSKLLLPCVEYSYEEMYLYLREFNCMPNISIYNAAVFGGSMIILERY